MFYVFYLILQRAMENQINTNTDCSDTITVHSAAPQFIIGPGGVVNLTGLVTTSKASGMLAITWFPIDVKSLLSLLSLFSCI